MSIVLSLCNLKGILKLFWVETMIFLKVRIIFLLIFKQDPDHASFNIWLLNECKGQEYNGRHLFLWAVPMVVPTVGYFCDYLLFGFPSRENWLQFTTHQCAWESNTWQEKYLVPRVNMVLKLVKRCDAWSKDCSMALCNMSREN